MDPRDRFTATVQAYARHRPDYPEALYDWILDVAGLGPGAVVVDLGCGTGIVARALARRGLRVFGVDPNAAMLAEAAARGGHDLGDGAQGGGPRWVQTDAETLALPIERADAIVGGQSFHWLDLERAGPRMRALLGEDGPVVPFWNLRDPSDPFMAAYEALLLAWSPEYARVGAEPRARLLLDRWPGHRAGFAHHQDLDRAGLRGRAWSSSYVQHGVTDAAGFDRELDRLFERHQRDGQVRFVYRTEAVAWRAGGVGGGGGDPTAPRPGSCAPRG